MVIDIKVNRKSLRTVVARTYKLFFCSKGRIAICKLELELPLLEEMQSYDFERREILQNIFLDCGFVKFKSILQYTKTREKLKLYTYWTMLQYSCLVRLNLRLKSE